MSVIEPGPVGSQSLIARVQAILLQPKAEWEKIDGEPATVQGLFTGYACILALIPAAAQLIGSLFPICFMGVCVHRSLIGAVVASIVYYFASLAGVYITALIIDELAPSFGGQKNRIQALKVVVYGWTAAWLAGIFAVLPALAPLSIVGLYSAYLVYLGLPRLMKSPEDKSLIYTVASLLIACVVLAVVFGVTGAIARIGSPMGFTNAAASQVTGAVAVPGVGSVDLGKLDAAANAMKASADQMQAAQAGKPIPAGAVKAVPADTLKALLPDSLPAGFTRTEVSDTSAAAAGVGGAEAQGVYNKGDGRITLQVTDLAAMGALATLGGALNVQSSKETATGYEKVTNVNGRMIDEEFDRSDNSGKYSVVVANRFLVEADGSGVAIDDLKGAVNTVGLDRLEGLAHNA